VPIRNFGNLGNLSNLSNLYQEGQRVLSARQLNRQAEAADHYHRHEARGVAELPQREQLRDPNTIKIQCKSHTPRGSVMRVGAAAIDPLDPQNLWFEGEEADPTEPYVITLQQCEAGKWVEALVAGVCLARVDVSDTDHGYARVVASETDLESADSGPIRLLKAPTETGVQELPVHFPLPAAPEVLTGVLTEVLFPGASAPVAEIDLDGSNVKIYTGQYFEVWDLMLNEEDYIEAGTIISFTPMSGGRYKWLSAMCKLSDTLPEEP